MKYIKLSLIVLALSIQANAENPYQALQGLADAWSEPHYYNQYDYSPPQDSFGPYKQYMQRQMELQAPPTAPPRSQPEFCIAQWVYSQAEGRYVPVGCN